MSASELIRFFPEAAITTLMGLFALYLSLGVRNARPAHHALAGLCAAFAITSLVNMMAGAGILLWLRPVNLGLELMISPFIYLFFVQSRATPPPLGLRDLVHLLPASLALTIWTLGLPLPLNSLIVAVHAMYLVLIALTWHSGRDAYPSPALRQALLALVGFMVVFVGLRLAIGLETAFGGEFFRNGLGYVFMLSAVLVLAAGMILSVLRNPDILELSNAFTRYSGSDLQPGEQALILQRLTRLMEAEQVYRDPELDLDRLATQIGAPARHISQAVNDAHKTSVPLLINRWRVNYVTAKLGQDTGGNLNLTEAMLDAGFGSKSAFNREFKRVHDTTPSAYRRRIQSGL